MTSVVPVDAASKPFKEHTFMAAVTLGKPLNSRRLRYRNASIALPNRHIRIAHTISICHVRAVSAHRTRIDSEGA
jgi:hypothetical protein